MPYHEVELNWMDYENHRLIDPMLNEYIIIIVSSVTLLVDLSRLTTGILEMTPLFNIVLLAFFIHFLIIHAHICLLAFGRRFPYQHMFVDPMFLSMFYPKLVNMSGGC